MEYVIYDPVTTKIAKSLILPDYETDPIHVTSNMEPGQEYLQESGNYFTHYVPAGVLTLRPELSTIANWTATTVPADGTTITFGPGIPEGAELRIRASQDATALGAPPETTVVVTGGSFDFGTYIPGVYSFEIDDPFPFLAYYQEITAS